jgi:homoserine kinase type II
MAVKTPFSPQDFNQILTQYELGEFSHSKPISLGTVQTNYCIYTTQGKYVFRYYENRSKESVLFESDLLAYLKKHQYPCPTPFQNKHGACVGIYREKPYVIYEFINGQHIDHPNDHHKQQLIQKVAELQNLTQNYHPRYKEYRWNYNIELCGILARAEAQKTDTDDAREKLTWLENQLSALDLPESLPKGICHCDFHFSNVLFQDNLFVGLIDFDDANYTYLVFDLVCLIDSWAWPFQSDALDFARAREIVQEYAKHRPLSEIERRHLVDVHKLSILFDCIWYFGRGQAGDFYERRKIEYLNAMGYERYADALFFGKNPPRWEHCCWQC